MAIMISLNYPFSNQQRVVCLLAGAYSQEIPRVKPDEEAGVDAVAGFYKEVGVMTTKV